jgi:asparagine synthase (glutamine-hydrolysing)
MKPSPFNKIALKRLNKTSVGLGLTAVTATQLWHHLYISGDLCELPKATD